MTGPEAYRIRNQTIPEYRMLVVFDVMNTVKYWKQNGVKAADIAPFFGCFPRWSRIMTHMEIMLLREAD